MTRVKTYEEKRVERICKRVDKLLKNDNPHKIIKDIKNSNIKKHFPYLGIGYERRKSRVQ